MGLYFMFSICIWYLYAVLQAEQKQHIEKAKILIDEILHKVRRVIAD